MSKTANWTHSSQQKKTKNILAECTDALVQKKSISRQHTQHIRFVPRTLLLLVFKFLWPTVWHRRHSKSALMHFLSSRSWPVHVLWQRTFQSFHSFMRSFILPSAFDAQRWAKMSASFFLLFMDINFCSQCLFLFVIHATRESARCEMYLLLVGS